MNASTEVTITVALSEAQAEAFAQFLKRVGFSDYRSLAIDEDEAYTMRAAGEAIRKGLDERGFSPR